MSDADRTREPDGHKPEWAPPGAGKAFAGNVRKGVPGGGDPPGGPPPSRRAALSTDALVAGIRARDRTLLGRAITLIESNAARHQEQAQDLLKALLAEPAPSIRIGISGMPGAGKSTLIEAFGLHLIAQGHRVAVLAIDPTSSVTGGSILGDKTRMERLARHADSFIRPSPSGGALGGVARKTRETMLVCEAAGFDVILVETVGVGQNEIAVRSMVDFFLLVQIAGAGDELQGIKKGVIEIADQIVINKADGDNRPRAESARQDLGMALHYLPPATEGWETRVRTCSALHDEGIAEIWSVVRRFEALTRDSGVFDRRRRGQARDWLHAMIREYLERRFATIPAVKAELGRMEAEVMSGDLPVTAAANRLLSVFEAALRESPEPQKK